MNQQLHLFDLRTSAERIRDIHAMCPCIHDDDVRCGELTQAQDGICGECKFHREYNDAMRGDA